MTEAGRRTVFYGICAVFFLSILLNLLGTGFMCWVMSDALGSGDPFTVFFGLFFLLELFVSTYGLNNLNKRWVNIAGTISGMPWVLLFALMAFRRPDNTVHVVVLTCLFAYLALFNLGKAACHYLLIGPKRPATAAGTQNRIFNEFD